MVKNDFIVYTDNYEWFRSWGHGLSFVLGNVYDGIEYDNIKAQIDDFNHRIAGSEVFNILKLREGEQNE